MSIREPMEELVYNLLLQLGENPSRAGLADTPKRVAKSLKEITDGYGKSAADVIGDGIFLSDASGIVVQKHTEFYSVCEHHMLPFFGEINLAYIPDGKIIGLSKIGRVIDVFAHRLQVQERLTEELADAFLEILAPKSLAIKVEAQHFCMMMRGVRKQKGNTITITVRGDAARDSQARRELYGLLEE